MDWNASGGNSQDGKAQDTSTGSFESWQKRPVADTVTASFDTTASSALLLWLSKIRFRKGGYFVQSLEEYDIVVQCARELAASPWHAVSHPRPEHAMQLFALALSGLVLCICAYLNAFRLSELVQAANSVELARK